MSLTQEGKEWLVKLAEARGKFNSKDYEDHMNRLFSTLLLTPNLQIEQFAKEREELLVTHFQALES